MPQVGVLSKGMNGLIWFLAWRLLLTNPTYVLRKFRIYTRPLYFIAEIVKPLSTARFCRAGQLATADSCFTVALMFDRSVSAIWEPVGWPRGVVVSGVRRINEVNARRAWLVP